MEQRNKQKWKKRIGDGPGDSSFSSGKKYVLTLIVLNNSWKQHGAVMNMPDKEVSYLHRLNRVNKGIIHVTHKRIDIYWIH